MRGPRHYHHNVCLFWLLEEANPSHGIVDPFRSRRYPSWLLDWIVHLVGSSYVIGIVTSDAMSPRVNEWDDL